MRWCLPKINVYVCVGEVWSMCLDLYFGKIYPDLKDTNNFSWLDSGQQVHFHFLMIFRAFAFCPAILHIFNDFPRFWTLFCDFTHFSVFFCAFASCSGILHSFLGFSTILHIFKRIPTLSQLFLQFHIFPSDYLCFLNSLGSFIHFPIILYFFYNFFFIALNLLNTSTWIKRGLHDAFLQFYFVL